MSILEVKGLRKVYTTRFGGNQVEALRNVSFSVEQGEYVAVMGESGSGKTMITCGLLELLRCEGHPVSFKCGPDYIDPMFHRFVLGIPSRNLDTFFTDAG